MKRSVKNTKIIIYKRRKYINGDGKIEPKKLKVAVRYLEFY